MKIRTIKRYLIQAMILAPIIAGLLTMVGAIGLGLLLGVHGYLKGDLESVALGFLTICAVIWLARSLTGRT